MLRKIVLIALAVALGGVARTAYAGGAGGVGGTGGMGGSGAQAGMDEGGYGPDDYPEQYDAGGVPSANIVGGVLLAAWLGFGAWRRKRSLNG